MGGKTYRRVLRSVGSYYTMAGPVSIERTLYRVAESGMLRRWMPSRCGPEWAMAGCRDGGGDGVECQRAPSREAEAASERWQRLPYCAARLSGRASCGKQCGSKREEVERALVETMEILDGAHAISVSLDRVSIPMEEPRKKDNGSPKKESECESEKASPASLNRSPKGVRKRKAKMRSVQRVFRMAHAATVTLHDATGRPFTPCDMAGCRRGHRWPVHSA